VAGLVVGKEAAPIIGYMRRWPLGYVINYCKAKGWKVEAIQKD